MKPIVNSVAFILLKNKKILAEKRSLNKKVDPGQICIPSGGIEKGETAEEALIRECKEEFGIQITEYFFVERLLYVHKKADFLTNYFVVTNWEGKIQKLEADELIWINKDDYSALHPYTDKEALRKLNNFVHEKILAIIKSGKDNYLLLRTNKRFMRIDNWYLVSGGIDKGESKKEACKREIKEETGLDVLEIKETNKIFEFEWPKNSGINHREHLMLVKVKEKEPKLSVEHLEYKWLLGKEFLDKIDWYSDKKELEEILKNAFLN